MWRSIRFLIVMAAAVAQSGAQPATTQDGVQWGPSVDGMRLRAMTDAPSYGLMEPILLRVEIQNVGSKARGTLSLGLLDDCTLEVTGPTGEKSPLTLWGRVESKHPPGGSAVYTSLAPGASLTLSGLINRKYDMTLEGKYTLVVHWPPGGPGSHTDLASSSLNLAVWQQASGNN
jgi:hypothetical protein